MRQGWALACPRRHWKDTESISYLRTNAGTHAWWWISLLARAGKKSSPIAAMGPNRPGRGSKVRTRIIELHDAWSCCTARIAAPVARPLAPLPQPSQRPLERIRHPPGIRPISTGIRRRSNQLSSNARRLRGISPDQGMCEVSDPRHLTPCGSGLSRTEPPGRKELPGTPAESGHGSFQSRSRWGLHPRRDHFESVARIGDRS